MPYKLLLACFVFLVGCGPGPKMAANVCPGHQTEVWNAAISFYLERGLTTNDLIDPGQLTKFFPAGQVVRCPRGTNNYAPFRILDGPKCAQHPIHKIPKRVAKLREGAAR